MTGNAVVRAQAFIKPRGIRQSYSREPSGREDTKRGLLAKPLGPSSFPTKHMTQPTENLSESRSDEHMLGHGFYNKNSHEQGKANTYALPLIVEAVNRVDLGQIGSEFRIADYGSAQGQNSLLPMKTAIARIKTLAANSGKTSIPISITHTDLPTNDWTTLFQTVLFSPDSYLVGEQDVFCFASGTSVYQQIFPPNHIAFGYSAMVETGRPPNQATQRTADRPYA
jgi:SAM dependent carboxyl methyltransferase